MSNGRVAAEQQASVGCVVFRYESHVTRVSRYPVYSCAGGVLRGQVAVGDGCVGRRWGGPERGHKGEEGVASLLVGSSLCLTRTKVPSTHHLQHLATVLQKNAHVLDISSSKVFFNL